MLLLRNGTNLSTRNQTHSLTEHHPSFKIPGTKKSSCLKIHIAPPRQTTRTPKASGLPYTKENDIDKKRDRSFDKQHNSHSVTSFDWGPAHGCWPFPPPRFPTHPELLTRGLESPSRLFFHSLQAAHQSEQGHYTAERKS